MQNFKKKLQYSYKGASALFISVYCDNFDSDSRSVFQAIISYTIYNNNINRQQYKFLRPLNILVLGDMEYFYGKI